MPHIARIGTRVFAHRSRFGDAARELRHVFGIVDLVERFQRFVRFAGIEPRFTETQARFAKRRIKTQGALEFPDGRRQMARRAQRFAQCHGCDGDTGIERRTLARDIERACGVARRDQRMHQAVLQQQPAAALFD